MSLEKPTFTQLDSLTGWKEKLSNYPQNPIRQAAFEMHPKDFEKAARSLLNSLEKWYFSSDEKALLTTQIGLDLNVWDAATLEWNIRKIVDFQYRTLVAPQVDQKNTKLEKLLLKLDGIVGTETLRALRKDALQKNAKKERIEGREAEIGLRYWKDIFKKYRSEYRHADGTPVIDPRNIFHILDSDRAGKFELDPKKIVGKNPQKQAELINQILRAAKQKGKVDLTLAKIDYFNRIYATYVEQHLAASEK